MASYKKIRKNLVISFVLLTLLTISCKKDNDVEEKVIIPAPVILSTEVFSLASNAVTIKSELKNDSNLEISEAIVYWSTSPDAKTTGHPVAGGTNSHFVYGRITGLKPNTTYYARIYASNSSGEAYSDELSFTTNNTVLDIMGNKYNTVTIGTQVWMVENLMTTKFNDGTNILPMPREVGYDDPSYPFYCWYENLEANKYRYGALYNYPAVASGKLCPPGWHVASDADWTKLTEFVGGINAGEFLKEAGTAWNDPNANNYSGFSAVPGGSATVRSIFMGAGFTGVWWTSTIDANHLNLYRRLLYDSNLIDRSGFTRGPEINGLSVRCIKD